MVNQKCLTAWNTLFRNNSCVTSYDWFNCTRFLPAIVWLRKFHIPYSIYIFNNILIFRDELAPKMKVHICSSSLTGYTVIAQIADASCARKERKTNNTVTPYHARCNSCRFSTSFRSPSQWTLIWVKAAHMRVTARIDERNMCETAAAADSRPTFFFLRLSFAARRGGLASVALLCNRCVRELAVWIYLYVRHTHTATHVWHAIYIFV